MSHKPHPYYEYDFPIYSAGNMAHICNGRKMDTTLSAGELFHTDCAFCDIQPQLFFSALPMISDAHMCMIWLFCIAREKPTLHIISFVGYFEISIANATSSHRLRVDEDGALPVPTALYGLLHDE
jgi:hypothetical protein